MESPIAASPAENHALAAALEAHARAEDPEDVSALTGFLRQYPHSNWRPALLGNLGLRWRRSGHFQRGIDAFEEAWRITRQGRGRNRETIASWAAGELAHMHSHLGHHDRIRTLLQETRGRQIMGAATEQLTLAKEALLRSEHDPEHEYRCGPLAVASLLRQQGRKVPQLVLSAKASRQGMAMTQVQELARGAALELHAIRRQPGAAVPVPSIVHWKVDHYSAVLERRVENGRDLYLVENPLFEDQIWVSAAALDQETTGFYLTALDPAMPGWTPARKEETDRVFGRCWRGGVDGYQTNCYAVMAKSGCRNCRGMPEYNFHAMLVSLNITDQPLGYTPPVGPPVSFTLSYNQRETGQPAVFSYSNLGPKWTFGLQAFIDDLDGNLGGRANAHLRGGGREEYTFVSPLAIGRPSHTHYLSQAELVATGGRTNAVTSYERRLADGAKEVYALAEPVVRGRDVRRVFLTEIVDSAGNSVKLAYDSMFRLTTVTDAIGQVTRLSYDLSGDPLKITRVTDPFGRTAAFAYDALGRLIRVSDVLGLASEFRYDGDFVTSMTTPYGTTTFRTGTFSDPPQQIYPATSRWIEATDPLGDTERIEFRSRLEPLPATLQHGTIYWDKKAWKEGGRDLAKATIYQWKLLNSIVLAGVPWKVKPPLESETVYLHPGRREADLLDAPAVETDGLPIEIRQFLEGDALQRSRFEYNTRGWVTKSIDPAGRTFSFSYSSDGIDLTEVFNDNTRERLARLTYNSQHLPLTITGADEQTTRLAYNARGQLASLTNAKGETITYTYDGRGFLTSASGPVPQAVTRYTHDSFGRLQSMTDSEGYRVAFEYDALNRPTKVTFPDGTFQQTKYDRLDPVELIDRQGRVTRISYDALRRPVTVTDPLGRVSRAEWCNCGAIERLVDPAGNETRWSYDLQGGVTEKILADGSTTRYVYGPQSGRLLQVIDPKGQITRYEYTADDNIRRVAFENASVPTPAVTFNYDANFDRLVSIEDATGTINYAYHPVRALGALQLASASGPVPGARIEYGYDELGRSVSRSVNGVTSTAAFDNFGRLSRVRNSLGEFALTYAGLTERLQSVLFPNGQKSTFSYFDAANDFRLREILNERADGGVLSRFRHTFEKTGRVATQERFQPELELAESVYTYRYDEASQLVAAILGGAGGDVSKTFDYAYDPAGNRTTENMSGELRGAAHSAANQLVSLDTGGGTWQFSYDANGNLISSGTRSFDWDARNRLTAIIDGGRRTDFAYDAFDRRVRIVEREGDQVTRDVWLVWCGAQICEERSGDGSAVQKQFFAQGEVLGGQRYFYTHDHTGSVRQLMSADGAVAASIDYDPFGRSVKAAGDVDPSFGYTSHYRHASSGLLLAHYRAYDPELGRWLSRDPIAEDGGLNLYAYAGNRPPSSMDPDGLLTTDYHLGFGGHFHTPFGGGSGGLNAGIVFGTDRNGRMQIQPFLAGNLGAGFGASAGGGFSAGSSHSPGGTLGDFGGHAVGPEVSGSILGRLTVGTNAPPGKPGSGTLNERARAYNVDVSLGPQVGGYVDWKHSWVWMPFFAEQPPPAGTLLLKGSVVEERRLTPVRKTKRHSPRRRPTKRLPPFKLRVCETGTLPDDDTELTGELKAVYGEIISLPSPQH
jgi:RHS repeat-associated protein